MQSETIEWCALEEFPSAEALLKTVFGASGQLIKKHDFDRRWLARAVARRERICLPLSFVNHLEIWPEYLGPAAAVLRETAELVALHKPAGIHTHPQAYEEKPNLVSWLVAHGRSELTRVNSAGMDRGCLYRLDLETSGLVLYAKSDATYESYRTQFATAFRRKLYLCIVKGNPGDRRDVEHRLMGAGPKGSVMKVMPEGQRAVLSFQTIASESGLSLVLVELQTGLRHQIRAQLSALGYPLLGDTLYGGERAARLFLHCWRYETSEASFEDTHADLFNRFFDLNSLFQVIHNKLR